MGKIKSLIKGLYFKIFFTIFFIWWVKLYRIELEDRRNRAWGFHG